MGEAALEMFPTVGHLTYIIDATMLRPEATEREYLGFLREVADARFRCAFVPPCYLPLARMELEGSGVTLGAPIGFPYGYVSSDAKKGEAVFALQQGARELDVVLNISALRSRRHERVREDIAAVVGLARRFDAGRGEGHIVVKVILETGCLSREEMRQGALLAKDAGADFVKTCTGFGPGGATVEDVAFLREVVGPGNGVSDRGRKPEVTAEVGLVGAGANRCGTSSAYAILQEYLHVYPWR